MACGAIYKSQEHIEAQQPPGDTYQISGTITTQQDPPDDFSTAQYDVATTPSTNVGGANLPANTVAVEIHNNDSTNPVFLKNEDVDVTTTGVPIPAGGNRVQEVSPGQDMFLRATGGTVDVRVAYYTRAP